MCNFGARADGARPRGDAVPRVRAPGPPRARRARRVDPVQRRRDRVGLRRGAQPDARGVGLGRRHPARRSRRNAAGEPIPADLVARMRAADDFGKGYQARQQMFYAAMSYWFHTERPADLTAKMVELQERYSPFALPPRHPHVRQLRPPRRLLLGVLHLRLVAGHRQGPVLRVRPRRPVRPRGRRPLPGPDPRPRRHPRRRRPGRGLPRSARTPSTRTPPGWRGRARRPCRGTTIGVQSRYIANRRRQSHGLPGRPRYRTDRDQSGGSPLMGRQQSEFNDSGSAPPRASGGSTGARPRPRATGGVGWLRRPRSGRGSKARRRGWPACSGWAAAGTEPRAAGPPRRRPLGDPRRAPHGRGDRRARSTATR